MSSPGNPDIRWIVEPGTNIIAQVGPHVPCIGCCGGSDASSGHTSVKRAVFCLEARVRKRQEEAQKPEQREAARILEDAERAFLILHGWHEDEDDRGTWIPPRGYAGGRKRRDLTHAVNSIRFHVYRMWEDLRMHG